MHSLKRAETPLNFHQLFECLPGQYLILSPDLAVLAVSDSYLKATLIKRENVIGKHLFDIFPDNPEEFSATGAHNLRSSLKLVLKDRVPDTLAIQKYDIRNAQGHFEERYWSVTNTPVLDDEGNLAYIINAPQDLTEAIKTSEQRNREFDNYTNAKVSDTKLRMMVQTVLDTIVDSVITINNRGEIQSCNQACLRLFGYTIEEVIGKDITMLMPLHHHRKYASYLESMRREVEGHRKDGSTFPMEISIGETDHHDESAFVAIIRDITQRKENEKVHEQLRHAQKMESLGQLTGGIAHDFNNLLAVILGNLDFLHERTLGNEDLQCFVRPSIEAAEYGAELTRQLLAFGRKQALQSQILSINELFSVFAPFVKHTLGERIKVVMALEPEACNICVDPTQIQNALLNLSVNARDAMPEGGKLIFETKNVTLDETYAASNAEVVPGDYVMIAISDTGAGMTAETITKAFEPFFTTKEVGKGTGLGLSMVYGFVKQSKGHVQIYSELGQGTTIKIYLPRAASELPTAKKPEAKIYSTSNGAKTILIVEDNKEVLKLSTAMVESLGYKALRAENGEAALKILQETKNIDLLLSDVMLPGDINGPELAKRALAIHPGLPVLFNSGYAEHAIFQSGLLEEGVHLITKPFRKEQLAGRLDELLKA